MSRARPQKKSLLFIISGPAGSGKTTVCDGLLKACPQTRRVVTATTRAARPAEVHGEHYFFLKKADFEKRIQKGDFIEYAQVHGNYYGTLKSEIKKGLSKGHDLLMNIDVQGAAAYRKLNKKAGPLQNRIVSIFILPPSIATLKKRLLGRGTSDTAELKRRLKTALKEIPCAGKFDYAFVSDTRQMDLKRAQAIYLAEKCRNR